MLLSAHKHCANKRWIAENVRKPVLGYDRLPIELEGISVVNVGRGAQRDTDIVASKGFRQPHIHLVVHKPQGHLSNAGRKLLYLNSIKGVHVYPGKVSHT